MPGTGKNRLLVGVGLGLALAGVARQLAPAFRGLGRPLAKAAVKSTLMMMDRGRLRAAELQETLEDLAAEARAEMAAEAQTPASGESPLTEETYAAQSAYPA
jgi:hypothetical protein